MLKSTEGKLRGKKKKRDREARGREGSQREHGQGSMGGEEQPPPPVPPSNPELISNNKTGRGKCGY